MPDEATPNDCPHEDEFLVEVHGIYDGALYWECSDCGERRHRWPHGSWQRAEAVRYVGHD